MLIQSRSEGGDVKRRAGLTLVLAALFVCMLPVTAFAWTKGAPIVKDYFTGVAADGRPYLAVRWETTGGKPIAVEYSDYGPITDAWSVIRGTDFKAGIEYVYLPAGFTGEVVWCLIGKHDLTMSPIYYVTF